MKRILAACAMVMALAGAANAEMVGVYVSSVEGMRMPFDEVVARLDQALPAGGWDVLASYENGADERCKLRAHTIAVTSKDYAASVLALGPRAPFALPMRIGIYEDASGVSVAFVNPSSIYRTAMGDAAGEQLARSTGEALSRLIAASLEAPAADRQMGQMRGKGYIGGMGGGEFEKKVEEVRAGGTVAEALKRIDDGFAADTRGWTVSYVYQPAPEVAIVGVTNKATEARAFDIAGDSRESASAVCPGLDHAAAFPIEIVVDGRGGEASVLILDEMYRMKLYFEDAGNWAFMKNMTMPGQIEDEIRSLIK
jgi:uncharacterized protein (DUF302 family)